MATPESRKAAKAAKAGGSGLRWVQSLDVKLAALFLIALLLLATAAYFASRTLVQDRLVDESFRYEQESGLRVGAELRTLLGDAQTLAFSLAGMASDPNLRIDQLGRAGPELLDGRPGAGLIASMGIWPEPGRFPGAGERGSHYWLRDGQGRWVERQEYNDLRSAPFNRERWYTPARYLDAGQGLWSDLRNEALLKREVLTFTVPIRQNGEFAGAATVSLDAARLAERFAKLAEAESSYALLLDGNLKVVSATDSAGKVLGDVVKRGSTLAELAKANAAFSPLALTSYREDDARHADMVKAKRYDAAKVTELRDNTRELSRQEAENLLTSIWTSQSPRPADSGEPITLDADPVLGGKSFASRFLLRTPDWMLVRVTPANQGYAGASYLFRQSVVVTLGLVTLTLVLAFFALRALVIRPLRLMITQLSSTHSIEDALNLVLDSSARNEIGMLAYWQNERIAQLREAMDHVRAAKHQLNSESGERRQAQEQLARAQERTALALQSVSDAVVITDEQGRVEEMNAAAETLTGLGVREARGKALTEVVRLRFANNDELQNLAMQAMERGTRIDHSDGLALEPFTGAAREVVLNASPMRLRGRMAGTVLTFHERQRRENRGDGGAQPSNHRNQNDQLTGLAARSACERRLSAMVEQVRTTELGHAVIFLDVDHLKRINDSGGMAAGDDVLVRVAETLSEAAPVAQQVYRLAADQFAVLLESTDREAALGITEALRERLAATRFYWESRYFSVTASFGIALVDRSTPSATEALRRADDACSAAKRAGRNNVQLYDPRMDRVERIVDDETWVRCIKRGLEENLFHLRTQWIMAGKEYAGEGQSYEVLLALEDEEGFWAAPAAFMPVAERHHLTTAIDRWVIERTLRYLTDHPDTVEKIAFCSINLSTGTLASSEFLDFIAGCLEAHPELAPKLCFEIREPSLTEHPREAALCCDVLHRMGCRLSIDHYFGRHLSDLTLLRQLPIDFVKLDAQGFKNVASDPVEQMLAESILRIVRHLRRRVIVNNIDEPRMMEVWKKLGADYFQGYAFAKPSPVAFLAPD